LGGEEEERKGGGGRRRRERLIKKREEGGVVWSPQRRWSGLHTIDACELGSAGCQYVFAAKPVIDAAGEAKGRLDGYLLAPPKHTGVSAVERENKRIQRQ